MPETGLGPRWRHLAAVLRGEAALTDAARAALEALLAYVGRAMRGSDYDVSVLDSRAAGWAAIVDRELLPAVEDVFGAAWDTAARGEVNPSAYATRHLESVHNRLVGKPDEVFDLVRAELALGREAGEGITQLAARLDGLLGDGERWASDARTIARTETIGAVNAGKAGAAYASAQVLGVDPALCVKEWVATGDGRTRPSHAEANGQQVQGLDATFSVGGTDLDQPGDPFGDAAEVVNCRCTFLVHYPGDPGYPAELSPGTPAAAPAAETAPASTPADGVVVDPGPQSAAESAARGMTPEELVSETSTRTGIPKGVARGELRRRGLHAAGGPDEDPASGDEQTGVVIVALPAADDPVQGIGPEQKHATLLYFGDVPVEGAGNPNELLDDAARALMVGALEVAAAQFGPFTEPVDGVESLGDEGARVWMLEGTVLPDLRNDLLDVDTELISVLEGVQQYPSYTPHVTIGYPEPGEAEQTPTALDPETEAAAAAVESINFDRLALWWAGEQIEYPLTGTADPRGAAPEEAPVDDTTQAALQTAAELMASVDGRPATTHAQNLRMGAMRVPMPLAAYATMVSRAYADGDGLPVPTDAPEGAAPEPAPAQGQPFYGILWPEDVQSGDMRAIARGATTWRDLPLTMKFQDATAMGHDGAVSTGRIDTIERDETTYSVPVIRYSGFWDTSANALEAARQVDNGVARGVSVDGVAVTVELRGSDGRVLDPMVDDFPEDGVVIEVATAAQVGGATVCTLPAFHQAYVANGTLADRTEPEPGWNADGTPKDNTVAEATDPAEPTEPEGESPEGVAASAAPAWSLVAAGSMPEAVEARYFANPMLTEPTSLQVDDDGRVYGHLAVWGTCHIGIDGICQEPPFSNSNYAYFAKGAVFTSDGRAKVGALTMDTGHASLSMSSAQAVAHYDNTGVRFADVVMGQDAVGIWFSGKVCPGTTPEQVYRARAAGAVSGDWREVVRHSGELELVAALVVNVPGFPIPAPAVAASGADAVAMVASGIVRPAEAPEPETHDTLVAAVVATLDRRERATAAQARLRAAAATTARRRLAAQQRYALDRRRTAALARLDTMKGR